MPNFGAGDVPALLHELGVVVVHGSDTTKGLVDRAGSRLFDGTGATAAMVGTDIEVTIQTGSLPGLVEKNAITVDGTAYVVASMVQIDDGELTVLAVRKP